MGQSVEEQEEQMAQEMVDRIMGEDTSGPVPTLPAGTNIGSVLNKAKKKLGPSDIEAHSKEDKMREAVMAKYKNVDYDAELSIDERNDIREKVIRARVQMLFKYPFFAQLAIRLKLVEVTDAWCPTAATDGRSMFYNPHFFKVLTQAEITFVVAHEVLHCVYDHMTPMQEGWDKRLFNISADYIINMDLSKTGVGEMPAVGLLDWQYDGWNSFEVYNHLKELKDKGELPPELQTLDVHIMIDDDGNVEVTDGGEGDGEEGEGKGDKPGKGKPKLSKEEKQQIANEIKEAMINAAQNAGAGDVPAGIKRMIDQLTAPKLKWQELVNANIESCVRNNYTFMRPTRRGWHSDAIMPGMERDQEIDVCICMDMSGSITNEQGMGFISEIHGMMQQFAQYKLRIWTFDTEVYGYDEFTSDDGREITEYELLGGGGTDFMCNWKYMKENDIEPQQLIMFTDGMPFGDWGDPNYCDTLFVIHSHYDKTLEAPFGRTVHFED